MKSELTGWRLIAGLVLIIKPVGCSAVASIGVVALANDTAGGATAAKKEDLAAASGRSA